MEASRRDGGGAAAAAHRIGVLMKVHIWSDIVCPWCYVGKRQFERALADFEHADEVEIVWRSYELDPRAPEVREGTYAERIARKYGIEVGQARAAMSRIISVGAEAGIDFKFEIMRPGNTFDAHRLVHLGAAHDLAGVVKQRFLHATFFEGAPIGQREVLQRLAVEAGLDADEVAAVLASDRFADDVRADERVAQSMGITGVPFFLIDDAYGVPGAQEPAVFLNLLRRAWGETYRAAEDVAGEACADEVCDL
ncbi:MAG TPA: DsbA family oxidoreductase [Acidimicrobiales bacterium]|nr:DsbA family oxidoreductase [Acidimicrobiales bacterium]